MLALNNLRGKEYIVAVDLKLELEGSEGMAVEGDVVIELPDYFVTLSSEEIEEVMGAPQRGQMIIAIGRVEAQSDIEFVTGNGVLMYASARELDLPDGRVSLDDCGHTVAFLDRKGIPHGVWEAAAGWLISESTVTVGT